MAILTFGATIRTTNSIAFKNVTTKTQVLELFRNTLVGSNSGNTPPGTAPGPTHQDLKFFTFNDLDAYLRGPRINAVSAYSNTGSTEQYWDDVNELAAQITAGNIVTYAASAAWAFSNPSKGPVTFTLLSSANPSLLGDGSVTYS